MDKRGKKVISLFEIFLIVSVSFAIAFIFNCSLVNSTPTGLEVSMLPGPSGASADMAGMTSEQAEALYAEASKISPSEGAGGGAGGESTTTTGITGHIGNLFSGNIGTGTPALDGIISGLAWAAVAFAVVKLVTSLLGVDAGLANALSYAAAAGAFVET